MQAAFRGTKSRQDISQKADAAAKMQARMRGNFNPKPNPNPDPNPNPNPDPNPNPSPNPDPNPDPNQARMRGNFTREVTDYELVEFRAAAALQAVLPLP